MRGHEDVRGSARAGLDRLQSLNLIWLPMRTEREQHDMPMAMFVLLLITMLTGAGLGVAALTMIDKLLSHGFA